MLIYHVNGQTLCNQKLKISGTSSPSLPVPEQKAPEQGREGLQPCRRQLPVALTHQPARLHWSCADRLIFFVFSFNLPSPPVMRQLSSIHFLKKQHHKKSEQCQKWHFGFEFLCHPLVPNALLSPCLFSKLKNRNSKSSCDPCQVISNFKSFANKKSSIFSPLQCPQHWQHQGQLPNEQLLLAAKPTCTQC